MSEFSFDVVIVGGGPVGFWLSCELRLAGLTVCVLERRPERTQQSRALTIHGRTLELLAMRGVADRFLAEGKPIPSGHFGVLGTRVDFSGFDSPFPFTLFLPQARTEEFIEAHALALGVVIRRDCMVDRAGQDGSEAWVECSHGGSPVRYTGRYLVGADGARSVIRSAADIEFLGVPATSTIMLGDVELELPAGRPVISEVSESGCLMIAPLGDGRHHRIVLFDPSRKHIPTTQPVDLAELLDGTRRVAGTDFQARNPIWLSRFADETRLASHYRRGRMLLAGDAAHIHAPMGGQGMNVGLQDAMNLGWKLAAVLKGQAPEALLDSYEAERRPVGQRLYVNTLSQVALVTVLDAAHLALRSMMEEILRLPAVNHQIAGELSGFSVGYPEPLMPGEEADGELPTWRGQRLGDFKLALSEGGQSSLFSLLAAGLWLSISFDDAPPIPAPEWLSTASVLTVRARRTVDAGPLASIQALLVRPDGYCAQAR